MAEKQDKIDHFIDGYQEFIRSEDQLSFLLAICFLKKGNYIEAHRLFNISLKRMFISPMIWRDTGQLNWLMDICILSGGEQFFPDVLREFKLYKQAPRPGITVTADYGYALMELIMPTGWDISISITDLLKRPKWKLWYAIGQVIQSIINGNSDDFKNYMLEMLKVHERSAKMGSLPQTAEGLICMQGMSLAYVARKRDVIIDIENDYLPLRYLDFLKERNPTHL